MTLFELIGQPVNARMVEGNRNPTALAMARLRTFKMLRQPLAFLPVSIFGLYLQITRYFSGLLGIFRIFLIKEKCHEYKKDTAGFKKRDFLVPQKNAHKGADKWFNSYKNCGL